MLTFLNLSAMLIFAFGDKVLPFSEKLVLYRREHKVEEVGEAQSQDDEMRDEQSDTETAESVKETCKRQGHPIVGIVRAPGKSAIDEIEVTLKEDSVGVAAATENDKKRQKKTVTFAEKIRVKEFEVDGTKEGKMRRNRRNRRAHNDELDDYDESDDDEPLTIISCAIPLSKRHNLKCGCRLFLPLAC